MNSQWRIFFNYANFTKLRFKLNNEKSRVFCLQSRSNRMVNYKMPKWVYIAHQLISKMFGVTKAKKDKGVESTLQQNNQMITVWKNLLN